MEFQKRLLKLLYNEYITNDLKQKIMSTPRYTQCLRKCRYVMKNKSKYCWIEAL